MRRDENGVNPEEVLVEFGRELRHAREARGLSRVRLAQRCGLSLATIKNLETGRGAHPRLETMIRLADGLEVTLLDLVRSVDPRLSADERREAGAVTVWLANLDEPSRALVHALIRVLDRTQPDGALAQPATA